MSKGMLAIHTILQLPAAIVPLKELLSSRTVHALALQAPLPKPATSISSHASL